MNLLKKIFSLSCLAISLFLLFYTFYKSEIVWNGAKNNYYLTYYIISIILIIFSIITFYLNEKVKDYLIISLISVVISLYLFEGYLTFKPLPQEKLYEKETGKKYDKRTKFKIYSDLKKLNNDIKVVVYPNNYLKEINKLFPLSGISNSKTIYCNENSYYSIYDSDRYGFNNPEEEWDQNEIEYLLVGDSFTHGACVNVPNDIGSVLRTLSNKSVLNLGFGGNAPLIQYATLREYYNSKVKKVIWLFDERSDLSDLSLELKNKVLINYLKDLNFSQNLKIKQNEINNLVNTRIEREIKIERERRENQFTFKFIKFIKIYNLRNNTFPKLQPLSQYRPQPRLEFKEILELVKDLMSKNNSELYFVYLPEYGRYEKSYDNNNYILVKKILNELDIPFIDIHTEVFEKEQNPLKLFPFGLYGHYNVEGYRKIAETIYKFTKN